MKPITRAFKELNRIGYFAEKNFMCCNTCGWALVPEHKLDKAVFYHSQDNDDLKESGSCYLSWCGDGNEICSIFNKYGIKTEWDGSDSSRILITI